MTWNNARPVNRSAWTPGEIQQLSTLRRQGTPVAKIAATLGRSEGAVHARLHVLGATTPKTGSRIRPCMCCGGDFRSEGAHNRLCAACRKIETNPYTP